MFQFHIDDDQDQGDSSSKPNEDIVKEEVPPEHLFTIGNKIKCDKYTGVVKYIGEVTPHAGTWLGIEWDEPSRGKHSGTVDGIQYFQSTKPNAASFIRPQKARKLMDVFTALEERYGYDQKVMSSLKLVDKRSTPRTFRYEELTTLDLVGKEIVDLGKPGELARLCPKVEFLNLAENLISSWKEIVEACQPFKHLKGLDLSGNPLCPVDFQPLNSTPAFPHLEHIILRNTNSDWNDILCASQLFPEITNLQVPYNLVNRIVPPTNSLLNLTHLDLEFNQINSWEEVIKLNVFLNLEYLNLCWNQIKNIRFPLNPVEEKNAQTTSYFMKLTRLNLSHNCIEDWISISELNKLQVLSELRIAVNPVLTKDANETNRQMIIARIKNLKKLAGAEITDSERRDAEIDYIKAFAEKWRNEGTELRFAVENPRYVELIKKYGESEEGEVSKGVKTLQSSLITLELISEGSNTKPCLKKIMPNMTVQKLKMLLQNIFKKSIPVSSLEVVSSQNSGITFPLENDLFELSQYSVEDGDKVIAKWAS